MNESEETHSKIIHSTTLTTVFMIDLAIKSLSRLTISQNNFTPAMSQYSKRITQRKLFENEKLIEYSFFDYYCESCIV